MLANNLTLESTKLSKDLVEALNHRKYDDFERIVQDNRVVLSDIGDKDVPCWVIYWSSKRKIISEVFYSTAPTTHPKMIEALLNHAVISIDRYNVRLLLEGIYASCLMKKTGYVLTLSIARIILQRPSLLEEVKRGTTLFENENLLHSVNHAIYNSLNRINGFFRWEECHNEREACKKYFSLLFTLIVLMHPESLKQKNINDIIHRSFTPMELLENYNSRYEMNHPHLQELYDNFQAVIKLTKNGNYALSQKIKEIISYIHITKEGGQESLDADKLEQLVKETGHEIESQGDAPAEKCFSELANFLIDNLPTLLLDAHPKKRVEIFSRSFRDSLKRKALGRFFDLDIGGISATFTHEKLYNISTKEQNVASEIDVPINVDVFREILDHLGGKDLDNFMKTICGYGLFEKLDKIISNPKKLNPDIHSTVSYINGSTGTIIQNLVGIASDFLDLKKFLDSNPAPNNPTGYAKRKERRLEKFRNKEASEEALEDVRYLIDGCEKEYEEEQDRLQKNLRRNHLLHIASTATSILGKATVAAVPIIMMLAVEYGVFAVPSYIAAAAAAFAVSLCCEYLVFPKISTALEDATILSNVRTLTASLA